MDRKKTEQDENLVDNEGQNLPPRPPITIKKSKVDEDYNVHDELGRGKFGVVKKVTKKDTNEVFAAKWIKVSSQTRADVLQEIEIMGKLNHRRLVGLYDAYEVTRNIVLIMEFITGGELFERIANEESVTEKECTYYMRQLLEGLQYMHRQNIVHLDLKPENIVCVSKDTWDIKLIDFGLAKELKPGMSVKTMQGTPEFVAPEVINFDPVCLASDMWSVGVIAYILVSGLSPFLGEDNNETLSYVTTAEYDFEDEAFNDISNEAKDFIEKLLQKAPGKRKTADECLKHEWVKKNKGNNKIKTENLKRFLAKRRWQKSVNAVRAVRRLSSMSSLFNSSLKGKSKSVLKLDEAKEEGNIALSKKELSKSTPSVFLADAQLSKRAMKILDSDCEGSQSESGSVDQLNNCINVDDKDILEGLFKENKEILEFLNTGLENKEQEESSEKSLNEENLGQISEVKDSEKPPAKPSFLEPLPGIHTVPKGTSVLMTCTVEGNPPPDITWLRNNKPLKDEPGDIKIDLQGNISTLSVGQCELQDEGNYVCVAENHLGQISCCTKLEVQVSPDFVQEMKDVAIPERRRVQFDVQITGKPLPSVAWYHNKLLLQEDRCVKLRKHATNNTYSLVIRSASADRRGNYNCVITNPLDSVSCTAKLHIEGYSDDEDEEENEEENEEKEDGNEENMEENKEKEEEHEIDDSKERSQVSLKQEDIELYYDIKEEIGKGRFGVIHYGIHKATGREYAVKYIKVRKSQKDQFQQEINIMNHLRHRRFIRLYEAFEEPRQIILVLELMRGGELLERISEKDFIDEHEITKYVKQILEGVKDMHEKGVLHLDLKPQNIMFTSEDNNNLKLIDFGLARKLNAQKELKIFFGTPEFVAPEVVNYELITPATDIWSVGVIAYILLTGVSPFWNNDPDITLSNVTRAEWNVPDILFQDVSDEAKDFLSKVLVKDPSKRMQVDEAFQHPWIQAIQKHQERTNLISTIRLKKYHAYQKGLASSHDVTLHEATKTTEDKTENIPARNEVDGKQDTNDRVVALTRENSELNEKLKTQLEKQNAVKEELLSMKAKNKEQEIAFKELEKRNKLLEERNRSDQEATQRMIKLECDKREIEEMYQQKEKHFYDLSKKYESVREKADSYDVLEEKVFHLEKERKTSQTNCKMMEDKLKKLREENKALQSQDVRGTRASIAEVEDENQVENKREKERLENKIELLFKDQEIAQAEILRLIKVVNSQLEDLEEMERITDHKRILETRCKELEEQLVEQEHEGVQREKEIDEMEEDLIEIQKKLQKSHNELRTVLEENKHLKERLVELERTDTNNENETQEKAKTKSEISPENGHGEIVNGKKEPFKDATEDASEILEENGKLTAKCYQLEKRLQELMLNQSVDDNNEENKEESGENVEEDGDLVSGDAFASPFLIMDVKQLRLLSKKLMKANKSLLLSNEKLNHDKQQIESQNEKLRNEFEGKVHALEKENDTFKRLLKAGDQMNAAAEILTPTTVEALQSELTDQQDKISNLKKTYNQLEQSNLETKIEEENIHWRFEQKIKTMNDDKSLLVLKYEKELEESQNYFLEEQRKLNCLCGERVASVEKQNQNLKSQINELMTFSENKKNGCNDHGKQLNELKRLHEQEVQEMEKNLALTLSQQLQALTNIAEQEKRNIKKGKDDEIEKLHGSCQELNEIVINLQEQVTKYPKVLEKNEDLKNELITEKQRYEVLEKELKMAKENEVCENCDTLDSRVSELEKELVALRKLEEDNMLLASENEKLIEELELEKKRLELSENITENESKMKLEELDNEKSPSKQKENSKKSLKKKVSQLEKDCRDVSRKLQSEILKNKQQELELSREATEKQKILQELLKAQACNNRRTSGEMNEVMQNKTCGDQIQANFADGEETGSVSHEKDNDYHMVKEEFKKSQNRTHLLQTEIDRLRETYSNNLSKELEEMENKWTQRLRRECNAIHSEMAEEYRKQKDAWKKKDSELHSVIKELQIQVEETETERRRLERECNSLKGKLQNGTKLSGNILELPSKNDNPRNTEQEKDDNLIQDSISDRDLRRVAYKLKKDQWSRLGLFLELTEADIRDIDQQKVGKEEKAFRVLCQWRTSAQETNQVSKLALALEEIRRKDLAQFVMEHCMSGKCRKKLIGW